MLFADAWDESLAVFEAITWVTGADGGGEVIAGSVAGTTLPLLLPLLLLLLLLLLPQDLSDWADDDDGSRGRGRDLPLDDKEWACDKERATNTVRCS